jgi:hypothetical protein
LYQLSYCSKKKLNKVIYISIMIPNLSPPHPRNHEMHLSSTKTKQYVTLYLPYATPTIYPLTNLP